MPNLSTFKVCYLINLSPFKSNYLAADKYVKNSNKYNSFQLG